MVQPLPFTFTQAVAADSFMPSPESWLPEITPPVVPSLTSMFSAVVCAMSLFWITSRSLASGSQLLYLHQFECALPM